MFYFLCQTESLLKFTSWMPFTGIIIKREANSNILYNPGIPLLHHHDMSN